MEKKRAKTKIVLSQKVKLPKHISFYLVNSQLEKLWNKEFKEGG